MTSYTNISETSCWLKPRDFSSCNVSLVLSSAAKVFQRIIETVFTGFFELSGGTKKNFTSGVLLSCPSGKAALPGRATCFSRNFPRMVKNTDNEIGSTKASSVAKVSDSKSSISAPTQEC